VSPDGAVLATSGVDYTVRLWDLASSTELGVINRGGKPAFSADGRLLAIATGSHAELWQLDRDKLSGGEFILDQPLDMTILPFFARSSWFYPATSKFTMDGARFLHSAGPTIIWQWTEGRQTELSIPPGETFLAFDSEGKVMATYGQSGVQLWKIPD